MQTVLALAVKHWSSTHGRLPLPFIPYALPKPRQDEAAHADILQQLHMPFGTCHYLSEF